MERRREGGLEKWPSGQSVPTPSKTEDIFRGIEENATFLKICTISYHIRTGG